ncbi:hypothetical protein SAMN05892883_0766 [Jatrophihabitans sp. GAS493]|nr:hypothetical protein SAMN05892883_0766 [Jatrophihabitans sp. GAS493]
MVVHVVDVWTGQRANALKTALRHTNESFAAELGTAVRTIAKWNAEAKIVPSPEMQSALDVLLSRASDEEQARFERLAAATQPHLSGQTADDLDCLNEPAFTPLLDWLHENTSAHELSVEARVANAVSALDPHDLRENKRLRSRVTRDQIATAVAGLYHDRSEDRHTWNARIDGEPMRTSILTRPTWCDLRQPLGEAECFRIDTKLPPAPHELGLATESAAIRRVAEVIATDARLFNAALYTLKSVDISPGHLAGTVALTDFIDYAFTSDLMEQELLDALAQHPQVELDRLPLRQAYLQDTDSAFDIASRNCAGGTLALFAAARPANRRGRGADYVMLIQERSSDVLNSARKLSVIPKAFHQPLVDFSDDAHLAATLEREVEEELFGREELQLFDRTARPVGSTTLARQGDYATWGPGIDHSWQAEEDTVVVTVRWPSLAS